MTEDVKEKVTWWESRDFCLSKTILEAASGDDSKVLPRFGARGAFLVDRESFEATGNAARCRSDFLLDGGCNPRPAAVGFEMGFGSTEIDRSLETILKTMHPGERAAVSMRVFFDEKPPKEEEEDWALLQFEMRLERGLENPPPLWKWTSGAKIEAADRLSAKGVGSFKENRFAEAFLLFRRAFALCSFADDGGAAALKAKLRSNLTACHLKMGRYDHAISMADEALAAAGSEDDVKCRYRRGVANFACSNFEESVRDFESVLKLEPGNRAAMQKLGAAKAAKQRSDQKLGSALKKMFS